MAGTFKFELISPERILMTVDADQVRLPGADGDFTVLAGHAPVIANLRPGTLDVKSGNDSTRIFVRSGFADVQPDGLTVLVKGAVEVADMSLDTIAAEIAATEAALKAANDDEARRLLSGAIDHLRALTGGSGSGKGH